MKRNGSSKLHVLRHYLVLQGFQLETLSLLNQSNLRKLGDEYGFKFANLGGKESESEAFGTYSTIL
jgi:hypothetical protein